MSRIPGSPKTGGRKAGSKNKAKQDIEAFIAKVEQAAGKDLQEIVASVLLDRKTRAVIAMKLMEYRYGKPVEKHSWSGDLTIHDVVAKSRARVVQFRQVPAIAPESTVRDSNMSQSTG